MKPRYETTYVPGRNGKRYGPYFRMIRQNANGVREVIYIPRELESIAKGLRVIDVTRKRSKVKEREPVHDGPRGRPPKMDDRLRTLYEFAGYSVRGHRVLRSKRFFTLENATNRYAMLSSSSRKKVRSPAHLLELETQAKSRLGRHNRLGIPHQTFEECFLDVLESQADTENDA